MSNKSEFTCLDCSQIVRIPIGKHIKFKCPKCSKDYEIDNTLKPIIKRSFLYEVSIITLVFLLSFFSVDIIFQDGSNTNRLFIFLVNKPLLSKNEKKQLKQLVESIDVNNEITQDFALKLARKHHGNFNIGQICSVYDYLVKNWKYVNDTRNLEVFRKASKTIELDLSGDCDDFAILMSALLESINGETRISFAYGSSESHAFAEVFIANNEDQIKEVTKQLNKYYKNKKLKLNYSKDKNGRYWLNLDWFGKPKYPGGEYFKFKNRTIFYPTNSHPYFEFE